MLRGLAERLRAILGGTPPPPLATQLLDDIVAERVAHADRKRAAAEAALRAAVSDLMDARSEIIHLRKVGRDFEVRALHAEAQLERHASTTATAMLTTWARYGVQGGGDRHRKKGDARAHNRVHPKRAEP